MRARITFEVYVNGENHGQVLQFANEVMEWITDILENPAVTVEGHEEPKVTSILV